MLYLHSRDNFLRFVLFYIVSFGCAGSPVDLRALVTASRGHSLVAVHGLFISMAYVVVVPGLYVRRLSSCGGTQAWLLCDMWNSLRAEIEPTSPTLVGGFLITGPPEKSLPQTHKGFFASSQNVVIVQSLSHARLFATRWTAAF